MIVVKKFLLIYICNLQFVIDKNFYFKTGLYWRIHMVDVYSTLIWFILGTAASTYLVAFAYKNTKFILKHKVYLYI